MVSSLLIRAESKITIDTLQIPAIISKIELEMTENTINE